jgi:hypothetical protein
MPREGGSELLRGGRHHPLMSASQSLMRSRLGLPARSFLLSGVAAELSSLNFDRYTVKQQNYLVQGKQMK